MDKLKQNFPKVWGKVFHAFTFGIDKYVAYAMIVYFAGISVIEVLAYKGNQFFSFMASRFWLATGLFCVGVFLYDCITKIVHDIKERNYLIIMGMVVLVTIFFFYIGNVGYSDVNPDAAQQVAAGLNSFESEDWNYTGVAFLGYANRQYILAALPALVFGRSIFSLHMGFAYPFIIGIVLLINELRAWLKKDGINEAVALVPAYALLGFPFITEYFMNFEQAFTPVALTVIGIALFLKLYREPNAVTVIALSWIGCLYCDSYTPILATLGLLLCLLVLYAFGLCMKHGVDILQKRDTPEYYRFIILCGLVINIGVFFVATLIPKRSDRINTFREGVDLVDFAWESWVEFFTDANARFLWIFAGIILVYIFFSLTFRLKFYDFVISVWTFGVVLFANYLVGYTSYDKAWILQRNMIVIPVLVTSIFLAFVRFISNKKMEVHKATIVVTLLFFITVGFFNFSQQHQSFNYFRYIQPVKYMLSYTEDVLEEYDIQDTDEFNLLLVTDNGLQSNIYDYAKFFYPNGHAYSATSDGKFDGVDWSLPTFVFGETASSVSVYGVDIDHRTFENKRYDSTVTWYMNVYGK